MLCELSINSHYSYIRFKLQQNKKKEIVFHNNASLSDPLQHLYQHLNAQYHY
jgi:hypothetical protein